MWTLTTIDFSFPIPQNKIKNPNDTSHYEKPLRYTISDTCSFIFLSSRTATLTPHSSITNRTVAIRWAYLWVGLDRFIVSVKYCVIQKRCNCKHFNMKILLFAVSLCILTAQVRFIFKIIPSMHTNHSSDFSFFEPEHYFIRTNSS